MVISDNECAERHRNIHDRIEVMEKQREHDKNTAKSERTAALERLLYLEKEYYETKISSQKDIEYIKKSLENFISSSDKKLESFIDSADKKFASKTTETLVYALTGIILSSFIYQLVKLIM